MLKCSACKQEVDHLNYQVIDLEAAGWEHTGQPPPDAAPGYCDTCRYLYELQDVRSGNY